jgi:hypothetical protein
MVSRCYQEIVCILTQEGRYEAKLRPDRTSELDIARSAPDTRCVDLWLERSPARS